MPQIVPTEGGGAQNAHPCRAGCPWGSYKKWGDTVIDEREFYRVVTGERSEGEPEIHKGEVLSKKKKRRKKLIHGNKKRSAPLSESTFARGSISLITKPYKGEISNVSDIRKGNRVPRGISRKKGGSQRTTPGKYRRRGVTTARGEVVTPLKKKCPDLEP